MIITNEILETDNTVKEHKRIVGIDPDRPDIMNQQMPTGNKRTREFRTMVGRTSYEQEVIRQDKGMLTISKSRHFGKELPGDSIKDTLIIRDTLDPQYQPPRDRPRWVQQPNGYWLDTQPQWPWESIFYNQPSQQRVLNERYLYGYSFNMGL